MPQNKQNNTLEHINYKKVFEIANIGIAYVALDGSFISTNKKLSSLLLYSSEELEQKKFQDITDSDLFHIENILADTQDTLSTYEQLVKKDGSVICARLNISISYNDNKAEYFVFTIEDVTDKVNARSELKSTLHQLQKEEMRKNLALEAGTIGIWEWYYGNNSIVWDDTMYYIYGRTALKKENPYDMWANAIDPNDKARVEENLFNAKETNTDYNTKFWITTQDSQRRYIHAIGRNEFNSNGKAFRMVGINIDITELKQKDELIIAQSRHAAMGEMISMIAHQWRQPLNIIALDANKIITDIIFNNTDIDRLKEEVENILNKTEYLSQTIDDFRNFFRPNMDEKENTSITKVFKEATNIIGKALENKNIVLNLEENFRDKVLIYPRELLQVFLNLLKNSYEAIIEHTPDDRYINVNVDHNNSHIIIKFCDNGGGISQEHITKIFDPYFSTKDKQVGTGIGLYMSKIIVEEHMSGNITVKSQDKTTCFTIQIPKEYELQK